MLVCVTGGMGIFANPTWGTFSSQGYEVAGVKPGADNICVMAYNCTLDKFQIAAFETFAAGKTCPITIFKSVDKGANWTSTGITATLDDTHQTNSDLVHSADLNAGDWVSISFATTNAGAMKNFFCSVRVTAR